MLSWRILVLVGSEVIVHYGGWRPLDSGGLCDLESGPVRYVLRFIAWSIREQQSLLITKLIF